MKDFYILSSAVFVLMAFVLSEANAAPSDLQESIMKLGGVWVLESSEIGGRVYSPPKASGLMVLTERYWAIHAANPVFAVCEVGESKLVGNKMTGSIDSYTWVNLPPGTEKPKVSTDPMPYETEVLMDGGRISFEPLPGHKWTIEGDKITVGTPGALFDVWKRLEPDESQTDEIENLMRGIFVLESQTLWDGRVVEPPAIKGLFISTGDLFLYHIIKPEAGWGYGHIGEIEVKGQIVKFVSKSRVFVYPNFPPDNVIRIEPRTYEHELSTEGDSVSFNLEEEGAILTFKPGILDIGVTSGDSKTVGFTVHFKKIGDF